MKKHNNAKVIGVVSMLEKGRKKKRIFGRWILDLKKQNRPQKVREKRRGNDKTHEIPHKYRTSIDSGKT